ncbi:MAG TPA: hypothetical protein V6C97_03375, partial [Oculatellaceae cyanobacterium]
THKIEVIRGDIRPPDAMQTKLRMSAECGTIQYSYDDGASWSDLVDLSSCIAAGVNQGISDALSDDNVAAPGQTNAGGTIAPNECKTYKITLRGNSRWNCPIPVSEGFAITVSDARGGWGDSASILALWACPDGKAYELGSCGAYRATQPTDPLQSVAHMGLIGYCSGVYMNMYNTSYTVPNGTPASAFFLQANDGDLADNQGEIQLTVSVCNYSEWCKTWDFTTEQGPFHGLYGGEAWVSGTGWLTETNGGSQRGGPQLDTQETTFFITSITIEYENLAQDGFQNEAVGRTNTSPASFTYSFVSDESVGTHTFTWTLPEPTLSDSFFGELDCAGQTTHNITKRLTVRGTGVNPFGTSDC